jgi:hypothetical protein
MGKISISLPEEIYKRACDKANELGISFEELVGQIIRRDLARAHSIVDPLPQLWYSEVVIEGVNRREPGIYEWRIEGVGSYIGRYSKISRPLTHYARNVRNLLNGQPYRKGKPARYRHIHNALAEAVRSNRKIRLTILENAAAEDLPRRERELIKTRGTLNRT